MPGMRLYVGGLSDKVDGATLGSKLSSYVSVSDIDLKEKTDVDGNVVFRFAYVSVDAPPSQIEECMRQLNGTSWHGSCLRIEPAKESFLDRLKRERATIQQQPSHIEKMDTPASTVTFPKTVEKKDSEIIIKRPQQDSEAENSAFVNKNQTKNIRKEKACHDESAKVEMSVFEDAVHTSEDQKEKTNKRKQEKKSSEKKYLIADKELPFMIKPASRKKDKAEEEMLSSFKSFSSVWADSDSENNEDKPVDEEKNNKYNDKKVSLELGLYNELKSARSACVELHRAWKEEKRLEVGGIVVCETSAENKYVKMAKDLNFGQKSSEFSLLAQFSQQRKAVGEDRCTEEVTVPVSASSRPVTLQQQHQVKEKKFFIVPSDPKIEAAITWMAQSLTEEISKEFREAQPHLRELYKTRAMRALRKQRDSRGHRRGQGQGHGRGTGSRNPSQDRRWREKDVRS